MQKTLGGGFFLHIVWNFHPEFWGKMSLPQLDGCAYFSHGWVETTTCIVYPFSIDVFPETWENDSYIVTIFWRIFLGVVGKLLCILALLWDLNGNQNQLAKKNACFVSFGTCKRIIVKMLSGCSPCGIGISKWSNVTPCMETLWTWKEQKIPCTCEWWFRRPRVPLILNLNSGEGT